MLSFCPWANTSAILGHTENQHKIHQEGLQSATFHCTVPFWNQNLREQCNILPGYLFHERMYSSVENPKPRMTPKGVSLAEVLQGAQEIATLIACHRSGALQIQHKTLSRSTYEPQWASAKHGLSCMILGPINHSLVSSNGIRMWIEKHC